MSYCFTFFVSIIKCESRLLLDSFYFTVSISSELPHSFDVILVKIRFASPKHGCHIEIPPLNLHMRQKKI